MASEIISGELPRDQNGNPIQVLSLTATAKITVIVTTVRVSLPAGGGAGQIVRIACDTDCYIAFGTSSVNATATNDLFMAGVEYLQVPNGATDIAAIRVSADGVLTVSAVD